MALILPDYTSTDNPVGGTVLLVNAAGVPILVTGRSLASAKPVDVAIVDASGNQVTNFTGVSGGTSSNFGSLFPTVGTAIGAKDVSGNMAAFNLDASGNLKVVTAGGGSAVTIVDGGDVAEGSTTDAAVATDVSGTVSAKLRGLVKIFADVWDSINHWLQVKVMNTVPVTATLAAETTKVIGTINISAGQAITANAGTNLNTSALALEAGNLATLTAKDFATQATLALVKANTDNLDVALSSRALESGGNLAALAAKDFATQTTLLLVATAANQVTGNASLASIDTKTPTLGQAQMSASVPVAIASDQMNFDLRSARGSREIVDIRNTDLAAFALARRAMDRTTLVDRRGSVGRGSSR